MEVEVYGHVNNEKERKKERKKEGGREKWIHVKTTSYSWCTYRRRKKKSPIGQQGTDRYARACVCV